MIDIHAHILSNIDDGADTPKTSLLLCAAALSHGTRAIIATPHFMEGTYEHVSKDNIYQKVERLNKALVLNKIELTVYPGCEAFISLELPEFIESGKCTTLSGSQYLLVELPMSTIPLYASEVLYELEIKGIIPILAHPERNTVIMHEPHLINDFLDRGVLVQINSGSITGRMGSKIQEAAWKLLKQRAVHFVASDMHNFHSRKPGMQKAYDMVKEKLGIDNAELLFNTNPASIIKRESIQEILHFDNISQKRSPYFFGKVFPKNLRYNQRKN